MGVISVAVKGLMAAGVTGDALVTLIEQMEEAGKPGRTAGAARMARYRESKKEAHEASLCVTSDASGSLDKEKPPTPLRETNPSLSSSLRSEERKTNASVRTRAKATRIPGGFSPDLLIAEELGLSGAAALAEAANFVDYWRAKPTNAAKLDWPATWRVWCRKAANQQSGNGSPRYKKEIGIGGLLLEVKRENELRRLRDERDSQNAAEHDHAAGRESGLDENSSGSVERRDGDGLRDNSLSWRGDQSRAQTHDGGTVIDIIAQLGFKGSPRRFGDDPDDADRLPLRTADGG